MIVSDSHWWMPGIPDGERHEKMLSTVDRLRLNQMGRLLADMKHNGLYGNSAALTFGSYSRSPATRGQRLGLNLIANMIGAVTSKIAAKNEVRPFFDPTDADYDTKIAVERAGKYVTGVLYENNFYDFAPEIFRDACVFGTGCVKVYEDHGRVALKRIPPHWITIDEDKAHDQNPDEIFVSEAVDRWKAMATWPDRAADIEQADSLPADGREYEMGHEDLVLVTEGWRTPSRTRENGGSGSDDGRYSACLTGLDLTRGDECAWHDPHPLAFFRWEKPTMGFYGVGLAERLHGIQSEINRLMRKIQQAHHLITGHYAVPRGAKVTKSHINNDITAVLEFDGVVEPMYRNPAIIPSEIYNHLKFLIEQAYEISGISKLAATSQKPPGVTAAVAMNALVDLQTERFYEVGKAWEAFVIALSKRIVECMIRIGRPQPVRIVAGGIGRYRKTEMVGAADLKLTQLSYAIRIDPTSTLPSSAVGKLQRALDLAKSGLVPDHEDLMEMTDAPDTEGYSRRILAPRRTVESRLAKMIETGKYIPPEPMNNHKVALRLTNDFYHQCENDGVEEEKLELLRQYMCDTVDWIDRIKTAENPGGTFDQMGRPIAPQDPGLAASPSLPGPGGAGPLLPPGPPPGDMPPPDGAPPPPLAPPPTVLQ